MAGKIEWIGIRPERRADVQSVSSVEIDIEQGLVGDHKTEPHRQVTVISKEHLEQVRDIMNADTIDPAAARRNIMISGMDFEDLKGATLRIGEAVVEITGYCHPCSRMDENFGNGGRKAMARKAGWLGKVLESGTAKVGDIVALV